MGLKTLIRFKEIFKTSNCNSDKAYFEWDGKHKFFFIIERANKQFLKSRMTLKKLKIFALPILSKRIHSIQVILFYL